MNEIDIAVSILKRGGLVCYPTDTVYGIGGAVFSPLAASRIYEIKGRSREKSLPLLIADISDLTKLVTDVPPIAKKLMDRFWPGALTLIFTKSPLVPDAVSSKPTIAVRIPGHEVPLTLIRKLGMPIIGTSANLSGHPACTTSSEVKAQLSNKVDYIIQGYCSRGKESTVIDVSSDKPRLLREGVIPRQDLESIINLI